MTETPFEEWTFEKLVRYNQGKIILAIPTGDFNGAVYSACDLTLRWKEAQIKQLVSGSPKTR